MMKVNARDFHPMRGHVDIGTQVLFSDGKVLTVRPSGMGWALHDASGDRVSGHGLAAAELTQVIVDLESLIPTSWARG